MTPQRQAKTFDAAENSRSNSGRPPRFKHKVDQLATEAYLYAQNSKRNSSSEAKSQPKPIVFTGEHSLKIIDKLRFDRYEQVYLAFCKPGTLDAKWEVARLAKHEPKLAKVLAPLIGQLAKSNKAYDLRSFSEALDRFAMRLSPINKSILYSPARAQQVDEDQRFTTHSPSSTDIKAKALVRRASYQANPGAVFTKPDFNRQSCDLKETVRPSARSDAPHHEDKVSKSYNDCSLNLKVKTKNTLYERLLKDSQRSKSRANGQKTQRSEDALSEAPKTLEYRKIVIPKGSFCRQEKIGSSVDW